MRALPVRFPRSLATLTTYSAFAIAAYAVGCGDSSNVDDDDDGGSGKGGSATGGSSGKGGSTSTGGTSGAAGSAGKGGSSGKGGSTSTGGTSGGEGGAGDGGGEPGGAGGAGGEGGGDGTSGITCNALHASDPSAPSGVYVIDPAGNPGAPFSVVCDMTTSGGGWTLGFVKNSRDNGRYQDFGSSYVNVAALETAPAAASAATFPSAVAGWLDLNAFPFTELRLAGYANGAEVYTSAAILKSTLRLSFGQNGYFLYNDANGYYWCGGENAYTTDGMGQDNPPAGAPADCKGHTSLGDGWDFSTANTANTGLTICGGGSLLMTSSPSSAFFSYGSPGAAQAIWVR
jgi:hypothetical protein